MKTYSLFNHGNDEIEFVHTSHELCLYTGSEGQAWRPEAQDVGEHGADCLQTETECGEGCQQPNGSQC